MKKTSDLLELWMECHGDLSKQLKSSFLKNPYARQVVHGVVVGDWTWADVGEVLESHKKLRVISWRLRERAIKNRRLIKRKLRFPERERFLELWMEQYGVLSVEEQSSFLIEPPVMEVVGGVIGGDWTWADVIEVLETYKKRDDIFEELDEPSSEPRRLSRRKLKFPERARFLELWMEQYGVLSVEEQSSFLIDSTVRDLFQDCGFNWSWGDMDSVLETHKEMKEIYSELLQRAQRQSTDRRQKRYSTTNASACRSCGVPISANGFCGCS